MTFWQCCVTSLRVYLSSDLPNAHGLAVDWVSRNLFWTSFDTNKKQINVARLDGSFKNAVIQGLEKPPHCLVLHPILGLVVHTHTLKLSHLVKIKLWEIALRHPPDFTFNLRYIHRSARTHAQSYAPELCAAVRLPSVCCQRWQAE